MLNFFRITSLTEGISYLLILCVTLGFIGREFVYTLGMTHGALFILYLVLSLLAAYKQSWSLGIWLLMLLAAFIPFAFVPVELFLQKELRKNANSAAQASGLT
ncbi:DUF3817 domain-containing protein [Thiopseudomonas acetoxidans]|uniref:DUF3817 domain-containing protein n=1 Tax=Thiopseudomonas acetoxidans TaxID=3041622 RepID=A0ABT7SPP1_9GAMM|nr:DUF3817 domain-containing protein [Thiopseudomonas sp. CY1220]MDM7858141.1 DUF3817 domain-containing protein [Thiopseudomonas sp. CY1220]